MIFLQGSLERQQGVGGRRESELASLVHVCVLHCNDEMKSEVEQI